MNNAFLQFSVATASYGRVKVILHCYEKENMSAKME